jgi:hypothetical protein
MHGSGSALGVRFPRGDSTVHEIAAAIAAARKSDLGQRWEQKIAGNGTGSPLPI